MKKEKSQRYQQKLQEDEVKMADEERRAKRPSTSERGFKLVLMQ